MKLNVYQFDILLYVLGILWELYYYILQKTHQHVQQIYQNELHGIYIYKAMSMSNNYIVYICWEWKPVNNACAGA